jgi:hypothetical protein
VCQAQFTKGDTYLGGTFSVGLQESTVINTDYKQKSFSLFPRVGFLTSEKFALGGQVGLSYTNQHYGSNTGDYTTKSYYAGVFGERFFALSDKFLFSLVGTLSYSRSNNSTPYFNITTGQVEVEEDKAYNIGVTVEPSFLFFPSPNWSVGVGLGSLQYAYGHSLSEDTSSNNFTLNYGSLLLVLRYYIRKNNE